MIALTGATGHLGNVLVRQLLSRGERVRAVIPPFEDTTSLEGLELDRVEGDVLNVDSLIPAFEKADVVYHLAAILYVPPRKKERQYQVNVNGTRHVVEACLKCGVGRLVHTSSMEALVVPPHGTVFDESSPFDPDRVLGSYARSKSLATLEVLSAVKRGLDAVIVCPSGVTGPYDFRPSPMGQWLKDIANNKISGRTYIGGAYNFVDVRDVAAGQILACEKGRTGEAYILSGERLTEAEVVSIVQEVAGVRGRTFKIPPWLAWIMAGVAFVYSYLKNTTPSITLDSVRIITSNSYISHQKASSELGYSPLPFRETVVDTIQWFRETGRL